METTVCVCLLTCRRPELLRACLGSLVSQQGSGGTAVPMEILVIDNDPRGSAREIFREATAESAFRCLYLVEPDPGITQARNRALEETSEYSFVAFIDDDEIADPFWMANLLKAQKEYAAEIVSGPVLPRFVGVPDWVRRGNFFSACDQPSGSVPGAIATNNVLIKRSAVADCRFDPRFRYTGGSDTFFFMNVRHTGAKAVWCQEARVSEIVSEGRANAYWLVERAYSSANRYTRSCQYLAPGLKMKMVRLFTALGGIALGSVKILLGFWAKERIVKGMLLVARGFGTLFALNGYAYRYYAPEKARE